MELPKPSRHLERLAQAVHAAEQDLALADRNVTGLISWLDLLTNGVDDRVEVKLKVSELLDLLRDAADAGDWLTSARHRLTAELRRVQLEHGLPDAWCQVEVEVRQ